MFWKFGTWQIHVMGPAKISNVSSLSPLSESSLRLHTGHLFSGRFSEVCDMPLKSAGNVFHCVPWVSPSTPSQTPRTPYRCKNTNKIQGRILLSFSLLLLLHPMGLLVISGRAGGRGRSWSQTGRVPGRDGRRRGNGRRRPGGRDRWRGSSGRGRRDGARQHRRERERQIRNRKHTTKEGRSRARADDNARDSSTEDRAPGNTAVGVRPVVAYHLKLAKSAI